MREETNCTEEHNMQGDGVFYKKCRGKQKKKKKKKQGRKIKQKGNKEKGNKK